MKKEQIQTEVDASYLYGILADAEKEETIASIFREMSEIEKGHAQAFLKKAGLPPELPPPSGRAKTLKWIGSIFGNDYILGVLMDTEKRLAGSIQSLRVATGTQPSLSDTAHVSILKNILSGSTNTQGSTITRFEQ